ncbi:MAG: bacillithiol biosynthesis cysteine-adding enzyme BshC [Ferruginibacter sp.]
MPFTSSYFPYRSVHSFSAIAIDYVEGAEALKPFYTYAPTIEGIKKAIDARKQFDTDRQLLVDHLREQYRNLAITGKVEDNINSLLLDNTFTVTTAHQPNIFTGHLYFIYKILHAIKLADELKQRMPGNNFVPVYYMGSEDADLEELGEVYINGKYYRWETSQGGAVGRMKIDKAFIELIEGIHAQLGVDPHGDEILQKVKAAYTLDKTIEQATFEFVHELFKTYGLLILLPDAQKLKASFIPVIEKELAEQFSAKAVEETMSQFPEQYKIQAAGREINLFYLEEGKRERIERIGDDKWVLADHSREWSNNSLLKELKDNPRAFSPNVILRPVFQEWILPNVAFIGGGGELAYWLELKNVFAAAGVPYPVLLLRNSFGIVNKKTAEKIASLDMTAEDFFQPAAALLDRIIRKHSKVQLELTAEKEKLAALYAQISAVAGAADPTLEKHVTALQLGAAKKIGRLEKKIYSAEKKRFEAQQRRIETIRASLYPEGNLQERVDNLLPWYAVYGPGFIEMLYSHSLSLGQQFGLLQEVV